MELVVKLAVEIALWVVYATAGTLLAFAALVLAIWAASLIAWGILQVARAVYSTLRRP